jgi:DNA-binding MarR family transcriptional regulator
MPRPDLLPELSPEKYWEPEIWTSRHELVCDLHIAGYNNNLIAEKLKYSPARVSVILSDRRAEEYVRRIRSLIDSGVSAHILTRIQALAEPAIRAIEDDIKIASEGITHQERALRQKASFGVLGVLGYGPVSKVAQVPSSEVPSVILDRSEAALRDLREMQGMFTYRAVEEVDCEIEEADDAQAA